MLFLAWYTLKSLALQSHIFVNFITTTVFLCLLANVVVVVVVAAVSVACLISVCFSISFSVQMMLKGTQFVVVFPIAVARDRDFSIGK